MLENLREGFELLLKFAEEKLQVLYGLVLEF
jgi:hypothetical protein